MSNLIQRFSVIQETDNLAYTEGVHAGYLFASNGGNLSAYPFHPYSDPFRVRGVRDGYKAYHAGEVI